MAASSTVKVTFLGDAQSLARAAQAATGSMDKVAKSVGKASKIGSFFGSMAGGLALGALSKVKSFASGAVDAFAAVEDATGAAGVQFGDQLPSVIKFAEEAATSFGMSKRAALDAQNTFGTLGKSAGLAGPALSTFSQDLTGLAGDLASFKGTSTEQAIGAVGAALRGETEPIRAYGVMLDQATIEAEALAMGLTKPVKNMAEVSAAQTRAQLSLKAYNAAVAEHGKESDQAQRAELAMGTATRALDKAIGGKVPKLTAANKVLASQSLILKGTKDASGDYARTSTSTANTQKTLAAKAEDAQAVLGARLAPALTALRQLSITAMGAVSGLAAGIGAAGKFVGENATAFKILAGVVAAVVLPALIAMGVQWVLSGTKATAGAAKQVWAWLTLQGSANKAGAASMKAFALMVKGWISTAAKAVASAATQAAAWMSTQLAALKTIPAHAVAFAAMAAGWVKTAAKATASAIRMAAAWLIAMGPIGIAIAAVVGAVALIIKNWDKIKGATVAAWNAVKGFVQKAVAGMVSILLNFTGPGLIIKHWDKIVGVIKAVPGKLLAAVAAFKQMGVDMISGFIQGILDKAREIGGIVKGIGETAVKGLWNAIKPGSPSRVTRPIGQSFGEGLAAGIKDRLKAAGVAAGDAGQAVVDKVKEKSKRTREAGRTAAEELAAGFKERAEKAAQAAADAAQRVVDRIKAKLDEVKGFGQTLRDAFQSFGDITGIDTKTETGDTGFAGLLAGMRAKAAQAAEFAKAVAKLRKAGLNETTLSQLREAGPEGGLGTARNLLAGGSGGISQINAYAHQIGATGAQFADREARAKYGIGTGANANALTNRELKVIFDIRGDDADQIRRLRKQIRLAGGNVQTVLGGK